jgi:hypothetical protein
MNFLVNQLRHWVPSASKTAWWNFWVASLATFASSAKVGDVCTIPVPSSIVTKSPKYSTFQDLIRKWH